SSTPARLIDGHRKLQALSKTTGLVPLVLVSDTNMPNSDYYRHEMTVDTGILSTNVAELWFFDKVSLPTLQRPAAVDLRLIGSLSEEIIRNFNSITRQERDRRI